MGRSFPEHSPRQLDGFPPYLGYKAVDSCIYTKGMAVDYIYQNLQHTINYLEVKPG